MRVGSAVQAQVQWFACAWRGWRACSGAYMRTTHHVRRRIRQNADPFSQNSPFSPFFTQWVCTLAATPPPVGAWPPPNGGNGVIRGVTRRRHAASHLLMLQNPHRRRCGGRRMDWRTWRRCPWAVAGPGWAIYSDPAPLVWRAPEGPEGTGGLRDRPLRAKLACGDLAGGRARRRPEHPWGHKQHEAARSHRDRAAHASGR